MKYIIVLLIFTNCGFKLVKENDVQSALEEAYFEGQKDAIQEDVRIKKGRDSCWIWIKSPWHSGKKPLFNPSIPCE